MNGDDDYARGSDPQPSQDARRGGKKRHDERREILFIHIAEANQPGYNGINARCEIEAKLKEKGIKPSENNWNRHGNLFRMFGPAGPGWLRPRFICKGDTDKGCGKVIKGEVDPNDRGHDSQPIRPRLTHVPDDRAEDDNPCPDCGHNIGPDEIVTRWSGDPDRKAQMVYWIESEGFRAGEIWEDDPTLKIKAVWERTKAPKQPPSPTPTPTPTPTPPPSLLFPDLRRRLEENGEQ